MMSTLAVEYEYPFFKQNLKEDYITVHNRKSFGRDSRGIGYVFALLTDGLSFLKHVSLS